MSTSTVAAALFSDTENTDTDGVCTEESDAEIDYTVKRKRESSGAKSSSSKQAILTKDVTGALDRSQVTDRNAMHLIAATAHALGHNVDEMTLSRSSIRRARIENRMQCANDIKSRFNAVTPPLIVHWDGKLLPAITGREKVDRLPVIVTGTDVEQLLGVPKLGSGTGQEQANAVLACLKEWNLQSKVSGLCFDTTASNTGRYNGASILIEQNLGRDLLHLACRHHILEIVLEKVFTALKITAATSGPDIAMFKRFREHWGCIDKDKFGTATGMKEIESFRERSIEFAVRNLDMCQPRDDYKEFLELAIIFLGGTPPRGVHIRVPGALHSARWMARILYSYKMWLFRSQFKLKLSEEQGIFNFLLFVSDIYIQAWFEAHVSVTAPANDLQFLRQLSLYENSVVRQAAVVAFTRHLWYLSEVTVGLSFFDSNVEKHEKMQMVTNLHEKEGSEDPPQRLDTKFTYTDQSLSSFVTTNTKAFFKILGLPDVYLSQSVDTWDECEEFTAAKRIVMALSVVNDPAERGVKLIQDFNAILTNDEEQKQFLLQAVQEHRTLFPDASKGTIISGLSQY